MTAIGDAHPGELVPLSGRVVDVLYETGRTRVSRVESPGPSGTSILKEALGGGAVARTRHELRILRRLAGIPGIAQLVMAQGDDGLLFEDRGGRPLAAVISDTRGDIARCVAIGRDLALAVAAMHKAGVVHKDINPANILLSGGGRPVLFDFDLASSFGEDRPGFGQLREIVGTLAYLAPEQSGRTGGSVDERADLYALGATLYELTIGRPPFGVGDPLQMVHAALAVVAVPPCEVDGRVPRPLSDIIVRLLEKEPDRRYQSAEGLAHDLSRLTEDLARGRREPFVLGVRDFPLRLSAPSRLVGRESELAELRSAFGAAATDGGGRVVLLAGVPGVGKTAVVNSLRSMVATRNGWFVTGKFDQFRHDTDGAVVQALRRLGRLLLAGGDDEIAALRARIVSSVGLNLSLISSMAEFAVLLGTPPPGEPAPLPGDAHDLTVRRRQAVLDLLGAIASPERPVVLAIDDLQWATSTAVEFIDGVLNDERLSGVLLVGAYRTGDVDATHPLAAALQRWGRLDAPPVTLHLDNLPSAALGELLGEMLRLPAAQAADLAAAVGARTNGNPFDTVELVNALRRDGALVAGPSGWTWDATTIRRFVGDGDVVDLLATRIDLLPPASQELLEVMACLGGVIPIDVLVGAIGRMATVVQEDLVAALDDGLLVLEDDGGPAVRFRHDRVQQAAYGRMTPTGRSRLHLEIGRRLVDTLEVETIAAEQYLHCFDDLDDPGIVGPEESRRAAELFVAAAVRVINPETADRFLTAAGVRLDVVGATPADALRAKVERHSHAVLYRVERHSF